MSDLKTNKMYENMVAGNRLKNHAKEELAIAFIIDMKKTGRIGSVLEIAKETGLSPSFFYKNKKVRAFIDSLSKKDKQAEALEIKKAAVFDKANQIRIEILEETIKKQQEVIKNLENKLK